MSDEPESRRPDDEPKPLTEKRELPPLIVSEAGRHLTFSAHDRSVTVKLEALIKHEDRAVSGLLLWGILLVLHDLEQDIRTLTEQAKIRSEEALAFARDPGAIVSHVRRALEQFGIPVPSTGKPPMPEG